MSKNTTNTKPVAAESLAQQGGVSASGKHKNAIGGDPRKPKNKNVSANPGFLGASAENNAPALSENQKLILETLINEAVDEVGRKKKKGKSKEEAIQEVADEMGLTDDEVGMVDDRIDAIDEPAPAEPLQGVADDLSTSDTVRPRSIYFETSEEAEQAAGILMYKSIPWQEKGCESGKFYMQFENDDTMDSAQEALKRRWDFVENQQRRVAYIEFDNMADYKKVLDFIMRQNFTLDFGDNTTELDEDAEDAMNAFKKAKKLAVKEGGPVPEFDSSERSYVARNKKDTKSEKIDPIDDRTKRSVKIRKRWR